MNKLIFSAIVAVGVAAPLGAASAFSASPNSSEGSGFVQIVRDGCGRGFHLNHSRRCVPYGDGYRSGPAMRLGPGGVQIEEGRSYHHRRYENGYDNGQRPRYARPRYEEGQETY
jgi:hypothetical protein